MSAKKLRVGDIHFSLNADSCSNFVIELHSATILASSVCCGLVVKFADMKNYSKYFIVDEEPEIVYQALVNPLTIRLWTGMDAVMEEVPGTEFELYDESLVGMNLEFVKGEKIVQEWYFGDQEEPSIVTIKLFPQKKKTSLQVIHTNIPDEAYDEIVSGWEEVYMADLIDFYKE